MNKLRMMYGVCTCGACVYINKELDRHETGSNCTECGKYKSSFTICWWVLHSDVCKDWGINSVEDYEKYRDRVLEKCKTCENRFICHTSLPRELNELAGRGEIK